MPLPIRVVSACRHAICELFNAAATRRFGPAIALAEGWDKLSVAQRSEALTSMRPKLQRIATDPCFTLPPVQRARLIGDLGEPRTAVALVPLVLSGEAEVARAATESVLILCARIADTWDGFWPCEWPYVPHSAPFAGTGELRAAVAALLTTYPDHRRREVFRGAMALLGPGELAFAASRADPLARWFLDPDPASHMAFRSEVKGARGVLGRVRAWQWLGRTSVAAAALDRVSQPGGLDEHESMLRLGHLAMHPRRAERLGVVSVSGRKPARIVPEPERVGSLSGSARLGYVRVLARCRVDPAEMARRLEPLLADADPWVRVAAMRAAPEGLASDFCFDADPAIAIGAVGRQNGATPELWLKLKRSPHPGVRAWVEQELGNCVRERTEARLRLERDRVGLLTELRSTLARRDGAQGLDSALEIVRHLRLAAEVELELLSLGAELAGDARPHSAPVGGTPSLRSLATVASLLADCDSDAAAQALDALLRHPEARVRSNAAESISRRCRRSRAALPGAFIELKEDPNHRVLGGVLRSLLIEHPGYRAEVAGPLAAMLNDGRPLHRLAGLWVVERAALAGAGDDLEPLGSTLARIAASDEEPPLQARAQRCAKRLLATLRGRWTGRAVTLTGLVTCRDALSTP